MTMTTDAPSTARKSARRGVIVAGTRVIMVRDLLFTLGISVASIEGVIQSG